MVSLAYVQMLVLTNTLSLEYFVNMEYEMIDGMIQLGDAIMLEITRYHAMDLAESFTFICKSSETR